MKADLIFHNCTKTNVPPLQDDECGDLKHPRTDSETKIAIHTDILNATTQPDRQSENAHVCACRRVERVRVDIVIVRDISDWVRLNPSMVHRTIVTPRAR